MTTDTSNVAEVSAESSSSSISVDRASLCDVADPNERHLATNHLLVDLKKRTVSSAFVTIVSQVAQVVLNLVSIMILARLLAPLDFGLFAMVTTVLGYVAVFKDAGLSTATVQSEKITHVQVSNLFWINTGLSGLISVVLAASSPLIAWFYREPRLIGINLVLSITFLLGGLIIQHSALLRRQMRFKAVALIRFGSVLAGVIVSIVMAMLKFGYWSLVIGNLATALGAVALTWFCIPWRPQMPVWRSQTRPLVTFGANLAVGGLIYSFARGTDGLFIGRFYGATSIGLYSRAAALINRPLEQFLNPISFVLVPTLSRLQTEPERYRRTFLRIYEAIVMVSFFCAAWLLALSRPLTLVVLGSKWEQAAPIFAGFTLAAFCSPLAVASTWLFSSQGRGKDSLLASVGAAGIALVSIAVGLPFGPAGVAIASSAAGLVFGLPLFYYLAGRQGPVSTSDLWIGFFRYAPLWFVVCSAILLTRLAVPRYGALAQLVVCGSVGLLAAVILICALPSMRRVALAMIDILKELKNKTQCES